MHYFFSIWVIAWQKFNFAPNLEVGVQAPAALPADQGVPVAGGPHGIRNPRRGKGRGEQSY